MRLGKRLELHHHQQEQKEQNVKKEETQIMVIKNEEKDYEQSGHFKYVIIRDKIPKVLIIQFDSHYVGEHVKYQPQGIGKIYIKQIDAYCNSTDFVYEGQFEKGIINGQGVQFYGKSEQKKVEGIFQGKRVIDKQIEYNEDGSIAEQKQQKQMQQIDQDDRQQNKMFRIKSAKQSQPTVVQKQKKNNDKWEKFDVSLGKDDQASLLAEKALSENTLDAALNQLNFVDSKRFFNLDDVDQVKKYQRTIILQLSKLQEKENYLLEHFTELAFIEHKFWTIYQKVLVVVNSNGHYFVIQVIFDQDVKMRVYDPVSKKKSIYYVQICKAVWLQMEQIVKTHNLGYSWKTKDITVMECPQQVQTQDCGLMVYKYCKCLMEEKEVQFDLEELQYIRKQELFDLIKKEK